MQAANHTFDSEKKHFKEIKNYFKVYVCEKKLEYIYLYIYIYIYTFVEGLKVYLHVVDNIENFTKLEALLQTVACIVNCAPDEIKVIGLRPENSFIIIITMTADLLIRLKKTNPMNLRKLSQYKVDWIEIEDKIINIYEGKY